MTQATTPDTQRHASRFITALLMECDKQGTEYIPPKIEPVLYSISMMWETEDYPYLKVIISNVGYITLHATHKSNLKLVGEEELGPVTQFVASQFVRIIRTEEGE